VARPDGPSRAPLPSSAGTFDGLLLCDKPPGLSSHDVVAAVRRVLPAGVAERKRGPRVGHAGTLDPFATGLLLVLVGRATRLQRLFMELPKCYEAIACLGARSSTGDPEGEIERTGRMPGDLLQLPTGKLRQRPPAYSAVHVGGERAYRRARRGEQLELPEREVTVYRFEQRWRRGERAAFTIECSSGTYVRALIADLSDAYCEQLRRTAIGPFSVEDALPPPARGATLDPSSLLTLEDALGLLLPRVWLVDEQAAAAAHGRSVARPGDVASETAGPVLLLDEQGAIAVAEPRGEGSLKPVIGLR
jgi:tRNA pseudouridine55 synthase